MILMRRCAVVVVELPVFEGLRIVPNEFAPYLLFYHCN